MPDRYLCLDVAPLEGAQPPACNSEDAAALLADAGINGATWCRGWRMFTDRQAAIDYAAVNPTLVVIPLDVELVPLRDIP